VIVLVYDAYQAPLAQPRNVIGGYFVSSTVGVTVRIVCEHIGLARWAIGPFALFFALVVMNLTKAIHPPGGACSLIAVIGGPMVRDMGYGYVATSVGGAVIMVSLAVIGNNMLPDRQYPQYWY
jgi:CBS domain-containing membrane protein